MSAFPYGGANRNGISVAIRVLWDLRPSAEQQSAVSAQRSAKLVCAALLNSDQRSAISAQRSEKPVCDPLLNSSQRSAISGQWKAGDEMGMNPINGFICNMEKWGYLGMNSVSPLEMGIDRGEGYPPSRLFMVWAVQEPQWRR